MAAMEDAEEIDLQRTEQAIAWLVSLRHPERMAEAAFKDWGRWIAVAENQAAFERMSRVWNRLEGYTGTVG